MISILIISKNEEDTIRDCIKSVKELADEIVVLDDSEDKTPAIAEELGAKVVKKPFLDFATQRSLALGEARGDWVLYLDADERATPEFIKEVQKTIADFDPNSDTVGYYINRKTFYYGRDWGFTDRMPRLFRREKLIRWRGIVHETPEVEGKLLEINNPILHYTHRNFEQMVSKTNEWSEFEAEMRIKANHPKMNVFRFFRVMVTGFLRSYISEKGYKNGTAGLIESIYQAFSMFITYAKLWEKQQKG